MDLLTLTHLIQIPWALKDKKKDVKNKSCYLVFGAGPHMHVCWKGVCNATDDSFPFFALNHVCVEKAEDSQEWWAGFSSKCIPCWSAYKIATKNKSVKSLFWTDAPNYVLWTVYCYFRALICSMDPNLLLRDRKLFFYILRSTISFFFHVYTITYCASHMHHHGLRDYLE